MADKAIGELIAAEKVNQSDLFVLEQDGAAKKLTGQILENWLLAMAQGHGGIQSIDKVGTSGLVDTYRITLADTSYFDFPVTNGKSITDVRKTGTDGLVDTHTISYNDGSTSTFTVTNGAKGDKGDNAYTWIKYASQEPTESSHSMGDIPDDWRGEYNGPLAAAPTDWKQYKWYKIKGEKGVTGDPARLLSSYVSYMVSDSGTIVPSGSWQSDVPAVPQGKYLWTRVIQNYNTGSPVTSYSVSRMGMDGTGAVSTVAGISPDAAGNVPLTAANVGARPSTWTPTAEDVGALPSSGGDMTGEIRMNGQPISGLNDPTEESQAARKGYVDAAKEEAKAYADSKRETWTTTIATTWSGSGPYTQSVTVPGILASDMPHITPVYSSDNATALAQKEAWSCISKAVTAENSITFACFEDKPATAIPIQIEVMR